MTATHMTATSHEEPSAGFLQPAPALFVSQAHAAMEALRSFVARSDKWSLPADSMTRPPPTRAKGPGFYVEGPKGLFFVTNANLTAAAEGRGKSHVNTLGDLLTQRHARQCTEAVNAAEKKRKHEEVSTRPSCGAPAGLVDCSDIWCVCGRLVGATTAARPPRMLAQ